MKEKNRIFESIFEWIEELSFAVVVLIVLFSCFFRIVTVQGSSMYDNYIDGDRLITTTCQSNYDIGDVVVILDALENPIIKRVIATEGQTVDIDNETGILYIDGEAFDNTVYNVENGITYYDRYAYEETIDYPQTVPEGCVFVLGDNRLVSKDSRYAEVGMIDTRKILGKALLRIYPFSSFGIAE